MFRVLQVPTQVRRYDDDDDDDDDDSVRTAFRFQVTVHFCLNITPLQPCNLDLSKPVHNLHVTGILCVSFYACKFSSSHRHRRRRHHHHHHHHHHIVPNSRGNLWTVKSTPLF